MPKRRDGKPKTTACSRNNRRGAIAFVSCGIANAPYLLCLLSAIALAAVPRSDMPLASRAARSTLQALETVQTLLTARPEEVDLARAKLTFDAIADPSIDIEAALRQIDKMAEEVRTMAGPHASTVEKLRSVRTFIYVAGDWNDSRPFAYDMTDPLGRKPVNRLLSTYLATRRGNCVSMPILFMILAERIGLNVTLAQAPQHLFVKFTDDAGRVLNLETTSGGYPERDAWLRQNFSMTDEAIANGIYLRALTRREVLAVMALVVLERKMNDGRYEEAIEVSDLILRTYPNLVSAMLAQGSAYAHLIDKQFRSNFPTPADIPTPLFPTYRSYSERNRLAFERAEALGWREDGAQ